jgi:hypothetical protein
MKVTHLDKRDFLALAYEHRDEFLRRIQLPEAFVVRRFFDPQQILELRQSVFDQGQRSEPSWHPLLDDCPDYHRIHDNYAKAYVKARMHAFYFHGWYSANATLFERFAEIFALKTFLAALPARAFLGNVPSDGAVARVSFHQYPAGGGYLAEHVDPTSPGALIQTLVQASAFGKDFRSGGLYARSSEGAEKVYLDPLTAPGDLLVLSPGIPHGVEAIDPPADPAGDLRWRENTGKWTILPVIVGSDHATPLSEKPRQLSGS